MISLGILPNCSSFVTPSPPGISPTQTPVPPPAVPSPTRTPTAAPAPSEVPPPTLAPEELATSIEQVSGKWVIRLMGGGGGEDAVFTLAEDGTFNMVGVEGDHEGMSVGYGTYHFQEGQLLLESDACLKFGPTDVFFTCTGVYQVFVSMADGKPAELRFITIDDPFTDRQKTLGGKSFSPYTADLSQGK